MSVTNKPKLYEGNVFQLIKKYKDHGTYTSIPFAFTGVKETERQKEIRKIFNEYDFIRSYDEVEEVIYDLNQICEFENVKFMVPFGGFEEEYAIVFESGIVLHINVSDEYYGDGNYNLSISLEGVHVPEHVDLEEVREVAEWLNVPFNIGI